MKTIPTKEKLLLDISVCLKNGYTHLLKEKTNELYVFYPEHYAKMQEANKTPQATKKSLDPVDIALGVGAGIIGAEIIDNIFE